MGKLLLSLSRQKTLSPARRMDRAKALVASREAMAEHRLEALSHETAAWRGVQAGWPRLTDTVSTDCESPFMKAGCGKTARPKGFNKKYRNLFYDSGSAAVLAKA